MKITNACITTNIKRGTTANIQGMSYRVTILEEYLQSAWQWWEIHDISILVANVIMSIEYKKRIKEKIQTQLHPLLIGFMLY